MIEAISVAELAEIIFAGQAYIRAWGQVTPPEVPSRE